MCSFKSIYFVIFILNLYKTDAEISDKRLCVDPECNEPVSLARALLRYSSPDSRILSFAPNAEVTIYSKEAGSETSLWGAVINGKRGYVPKHLVREHKLLNKPTLLVDTELKQKPQVPQDAEIAPESAKKPYEVVDGTTIYLNAQESISPSSTESPIAPTALPPSNGATDEQTAPEQQDTKSVVDNVLSSISNWVNDDEGDDSEEIDAEDEDDEEDEAGEQDEESLEDAQSLSLNEVNAVHNLPLDVEITTYSYESNETATELSESDDTMQKSEPATDQPPTNVKEVVTGTTPAGLGNVVDTDVEAVKAVTEPSVNVDEEQVPLLDESTTPTPQVLPDVQNDDVTITSPVVEKVKNETEPATPPAESPAVKNDKNEAESATPSAESPVVKQEKNEAEPTTPPAEVVVPQTTETTSTIIEENKNKGTGLPEPAQAEPTSPPPETLPSQILPETAPSLIVEEQNEGVASQDLAQEMAVQEPSTNSDEQFDVTQNTIIGDNKEQEVVASEQLNNQTGVEETAAEAQQNATSNPTLADVLSNIEDQSQKDLPPNVFHTTNSEETIEDDLETEVIADDKSSIEELQEFDDTTSANVEVSSQSEESVEVPDETGGIWSGLFSFFDGTSDESVAAPAPTQQEPDVETINKWVPENDKLIDETYCDATSCGSEQVTEPEASSSIFDLKFNSDFFLLLITTAGSVIIFLFVYMALDKNRKDAPLVARINKLEKDLLITLKENELLQEKSHSLEVIETVPNEIMQQLTDAQFARNVLEAKLLDLEAQLAANAGLEEQIENLEKELETSTEVGMELNRIISEMLDPTNGSDRLKENVEQLQRQLLEQKDTINSNSQRLQEKEAENRVLRSDLETKKKLATDLQNKVEEMLAKILKIEHEKDQQQDTLQNEITIYQQKHNESVAREESLNNNIQILRVQLAEAQRLADVKTKEYQVLKLNLDKIKLLKNDKEALKSLLDSTSIKAEIQQLKAENAAYAAQLQQEQAVKVGFEKKYQAVMDEIASLKEKYERAAKDKVEATSKLEVLNNYFKKRESELQEEIIRYKSIWDAKEGEATSTTERIKYMQEEIENYKAQNETLKQEIISQEIDLKGQISMLEKKVHENWVAARQADRKLEDARQEAAQLRNRLTLRERAINEERIQNRLQSPLEQNGELPLSPHAIDTASPPLLFGARDHITKSPPIPGLPPFLPPPPGAFMPPPLPGMPPFMPPPPSMFPGDHRPPPLGRMSSPPLNSRYSPDTSAFSPYDRNSPSPPYDSEYGASPPPIRGYSPYNSRDDRRDYKRPPHARTNGRNAKGPLMSSGSDHSNDSLDKLNRKQSKMV